jgi:hypothetical protein
MPCYKCLAHSRTSFLIVHHSSQSSFSFRPCVFICSWFNIWKDPIEGAPTQRFKYPLIHELKMLNSTHFWPIHEQQVPPCYMLEHCITYFCNCWVYVKTLQCERTITFFMQIAYPFHWHLRPLVALVSYFVVAFVYLIDWLPQHYIGHRCMHVYK